VGTDPRRALFTMYTTDRGQLLNDSRRHILSPLHLITSTSHHHNSTTITPRSSIHEFLVTSFLRYYTGAQQLYNAPLFTPGSSLQSYTTPLVRLLYFLDAILTTPHHQLLLFSSALASSRVRILANISSRTGIGYN